MSWIWGLVIIMLISWFISEMNKPNGGGKTQL